MISGTKLGKRKSVGDTSAKIIQRFEDQEMKVVEEKIEPPILIDLREVIGEAETQPMEDEDEPGKITTFEKAIIAELEKHKNPNIPVRLKAIGVSLKSPEACCALLDFLKSHRVISFEFTFELIASISEQELHDAFKSMSALEFVSYKEPWTTSEFKLPGVLSGIAANPRNSLRTLVLNNWYCNQTIANHLSRFLFSPHCRLQILTIECSYTTPQALEVILAAVATTPNQLEELNLDSRKSRPDELYNFDNLIRYLESPRCLLARLSVKNAILSQLTMLSILTALDETKNKSLEKLSLEVNPITVSLYQGKDLKRTAQSALSANTTLRSLTFHGGLDVVDYIIAGVSANRKLRELILQGDFVSLKSLNLLKMNRFLKHFSTNHSIGNRVKVNEFLNELLSVHPRLLSINIVNIQHDDRVKAALERNKRRKVINDYNWVRVCTLIGFISANKDHPYRFSGIPLASEIAKMTLEEPQQHKPK